VSDQNVRTDRSAGHAQDRALSPDLLDRIFNAAGVGLCLLDADGLVVRGNDEWLRSAGFTSEEATGRNIWDLLPSSPPEFRRLHDEVRAGKSIDMPAHCLLRHGREVWYEGRLSPVRLRDGIGILITATDVTERRTTEQALRESETRNRLLFQNMLDGFAYCRMLFDERGRPEDFIYLDVNDAFTKLTGLHDVVGKRVSEVIPGIRESEPELLETYGRVARTGRPERFEIHFRPLAMWLSISVYSPHTDHFVAVFENTTERKQIEKSLREQLTVKEQLAKIAETVPGVICSFRLLPDRSACMPFAAPAIEDLYGISRDVLAKDMAPCFANIHPDDIQRVSDTIAGAARTMSRWHDVYRYLHPTKGLRWIEGWSSPIAEPDGSILWHGYVTDVTESKRAEEARLESERRATARATELQTVLDTVPAAVWIARDSQGSHIEANRFGAELLRRPRGTNVSVSAPPDERPINFRPMRDGIEIPPDELPVQAAARQGREIQDFELDVVFDDGTVRHLLGNAAPICGDDGKPQGSVGAFIDITERKRAEDELRESDRHKSEFLGVLSHELRNPLGPIRNSIYLLDRVPPSGEQAAKAKEVIRRQTEHLTRLVDDLLDLTRISRGKVDLQRARIDLRDVLRRSCEDHRFLFQGQGVELHVETADPVWVEADETRISQVVGNLLQNAAKFTREGGTVTASIGVADGQAVFRVRDDGIGIAPDLLPRVFEPFVQAEGDLARTKGGLGLGLALVKGLVELHGGSVHACSAGVGRGSEFLVKLPLAHTPKQPTTVLIASTPTRAMEILVIDDNVDAAETIAAVLAVEGHRVRVATDGRSGIAKAREFKPEVILCDIGLPDIDGYEIARTLRADDALRSTRLIALSGYAQPEDRRLAKEAGFDAHISKPSALDALLAAIVAKN